MSTPSGDEPDRPGGEPDAPFDPYRFGKPDRPVPPEYAPPGYVPDPVAQPYEQPSQSPYGQPYGSYGPYGSAGYPGQAPMAPQQGFYEQPRTGNGKAVASLVLGIASILLFWLSIIDAIPIVTSVVLGIVALTESRQRNGAGRAMAIAGIVCAAIGTVATVIVTVWFVHVAGHCGGFENSGDPGFRQCLQDNI